MPKKISLKEIKVQSFVTTLDTGEENEAKAGGIDPLPRTMNAFTCPTIQGDSNVGCNCGLCEM